MSGAAFVALGDSFVEGRGDVRAGRYHGWVPRFAGQLGVPTSRVRNLGAHGATTTHVVDRQLGDALARLGAPATRQASTVGVIVGVNDLVSDYEATRYAANLRTILGRLNDTAAVIFTATYPDIPARLPVPENYRTLLRDRFGQANQALRSAAADTGTEVIDLLADPAWSRDEMWCADGLHPSSRGHAAFAARAVELVSARTGTVAA